jgi:hypothetical protein
VSLVGGDPGVPMSDMVGIRSNEITILLIKQRIQYLTGPFVLALTKV